MSEPARPVLARLVTPGRVLVLAALVRIAFVLTQGNRYYFADTAEYEQVAERILHGQGLGTTPRAPLFPLEMALAFRLGGDHNYVAARLLQVVLGVALVAVVMRVAERIAGRAAALLTGLACALFPTLVFVTGMLYPTTTYAMLLACSTWAALELSRRPGWARGAALGVLVPLGWLADPVMIAPGAGLIAWAALRVREGGARLAGALALTLVIAAAIAVPYSNYQRVASGGKTVFMQKAQYVLHYSRTDSTLAVGRMLRLPAGDPYTPLPMPSFFRREFGLFRSHPAAYLHDVGTEFLHFFQPMPDRIQTKNQYSSAPVLLIGALTFLPVLLLSVIGLFARRARATDRALLLTVVLAQAGFYSLFFTQTRYRVPVEPQMIVLAVLGLLQVWPAIGVHFGEESPGTGDAERR